MKSHDGAHIVACTDMSVCCNHRFHRDICTGTANRARCDLECTIIVATATDDGWCDRRIAASDEVIHNFGTTREHHK